MMRDQRDPTAVGEVVLLLVQARVPTTAAADLALAMVPLSGALPAPEPLLEVAPALDISALRASWEKLL